MHFRVAYLVVLLAILAAASGVARAQENTNASREYQIKAAILFNFVKLVEWPAEAFADRSMLILGVLGEDPFGPALESVDGKTVQGRTMVVRRFASLQDLEPCQVLFVSSSERDRLQAVFEAVDSWSVLTVDEMDRFAELGGIIELNIRRNSISFDINSRAGQQAGLSISAELLNLARVIER